MSRQVFTLTTILSLYTKLRYNLFLFTVILVHVYDASGQRMHLTENLRLVPVKYIDGALIQIDIKQFLPEVNLFLSFRLNFQRIVLIKKSKKQLCFFSVYCRVTLIQKKGPVMIDTLAIG